MSIKNFQTQVIGDLWLPPTQCTPVAVLQAIIKHHAFCEQDLSVAKVCTGNTAQNKAAMEPDTDGFYCVR